MAVPQLQSHLEPPGGLGSFPAVAGGLPGVAAVSALALCLYALTLAPGVVWGDSASLAELCIERDYSRLEWTVLDWNAPAVEFYRSLGAEPMVEWTTQRLAGAELAALARAA